MARAKKKKETDILEDIAQIILAKYQHVSAEQVASRMDALAFFKHRPPARPSSAVPFDGTARFLFTD